jgi:excisionase family DNA binding protein
MKTRRIAIEEYSMETLLLRASEVQIALGLCRSKVYEMMSSGELPIIRIGRSVRVPADGLRDWVESRRAIT